MPKNGNRLNGSKIERVIVALTALALNAPSTYTIAWSKEQHKDELPILYAGIATSGITVLGAILGDRCWGTKIMWGGLIGTLALFTYVAFGYKPKTSTPQGYPVMLEATRIDCPNGPLHLMI